MFCPACGKRLPAGDHATCPRCGAPRPVSKSGVMKTSTILISAQDVSGIYHSMEELPETLRQKLLKSTNGLNAATILIADRRGREEIAKAIRNLSSLRQRRLFQSVLGDAFGELNWRSKLKFPIPQMAGALVLGGGLLIWFFLSHNW